MAVDELRPYLYRLSLGRYQCYLWRGPDAVVLVDTGELDTAAQLVETLGGLGLVPADLDAVVLTHFHDDHAGGAAELAARGAPLVAAGRPDAPFLRGDAPGPQPRFTEQERALHDQVSAGLRPAPPVRVDRELADGDVLPGGAVVVAVPGHTDGSIAIHLPEQRVLLTGDTVAHFGGRVIPGVFNLDRARLGESLTRLATLDVETACFGHGDPVVSGAGAALAALGDTAPGQA